jgi:TRAP-type mannitol/chloroaromatic compound transport system permease small subunit
MDKLGWGIAIVVAMFAMVYLTLSLCGRLLPFATAVDRLTQKLGIVANWLVLLAALVSAGNAFSRYVGLGSSNAWLELQWYMFAGMVLLGAPYTLRVNEHVRVDLFYGAVSDNTRHWIDLLGGIVFLLPMCILMIYFSWPWFYDSWRLNEASNNAGGLIRWPVKLLIPVGFAILAVQGVAEIIKRAAAIKGIYVHEYAYEKPLQ